LRQCHDSKGDVRSGADGKEEQGTDEALERFREIWDVGIKMILGPKREIGIEWGGYAIAVVERVLIEKIVDIVFLM
jgi:hypothetical protein